MHLTTITILYVLFTAVKFLQDRMSFFFFFDKRAEHQELCKKKLRKKYLCFDRIVNCEMRKESRAENELQVGFYFDERRSDSTKELNTRELLQRCSRCSR